jgi:predicted SprT family Zn-dependent metalloprotease
MNLYLAQYLARQLMDEHGLREWTFAFDHARRRFGRCAFTSRRITLSRPLTLLNEEPQVRDTILHEIAHALVPRDGHGRHWKAKCREIGAVPKRCYGDAEVVSPPRREARYMCGCERCNWWIERRRRNARLICRKCRARLVYRDRPLFPSPTGRG